MSGRLEQACMQKADYPGPSRRAKAKERRSQCAQREYFDICAGFSRADQRRG